MGHFSGQIFHNFVCGNRLRSRKKGFYKCVQISKKDDATTSGKSIIHDMFILNLVFFEDCEQF